eukprot:m.909540 g.909540  ORF g.909540 m.909540 type:complete len:280 (+) comp60108_c0_seq52:1106-1945(+)
MLVLVTPAFASLEGSVPSISVSSGQEPAGAPVDRRRTFQDDEQPDQETVQVEIKAAQVQQDQPIAMATNTTPTTDSSGLRKKPLIQLGMVVPKEEGAPSDPGPQPRASATTVAGPAGPPARTETKPPAQASPAKSAPVQAAEEEEDESGSDESLDDEAVSYRTPDSVLKHLDRTAGGLIDPKKMKRKRNRKKAPALKDPAPDVSDFILRVLAASAPQSSRRSLDLCAGVRQHGLARRGGRLSGMGASAGAVGQRLDLAQLQVRLLKTTNRAWNRVVGCE